MIGALKLEEPAEIRTMDAKALRRSLRDNERRDTFVQRGQRTAPAI